MKVRVLSAKIVDARNIIGLKINGNVSVPSAGFRTTLRSGTIMENAKLPLRKWYLAMAFMSFSKKAFQQLNCKDIQENIVKCREFRQFISLEYKRKITNCPCK